MRFLEKILDKLYVKKWHVGLAKVSIDEVISENIQHIDFKWIPCNDPNRFYADPFIFLNKEGNINVIYEDYHLNDLYGKISVSALDSDLNPIFSKEMLDTKLHLSYPYVFVENGTTYIIPEASKGGDVKVYEYDLAKHVLINERVLIANEPLLDSTILVHDGKYWLFATKRGDDSNNLLYIYYSDKLFGDYKAHIKNPVKDSCYGTRPAGNFIRSNNEIYRPAQNCVNYYGKAIVLNKIIMLNEQEYKEESVFEIHPPLRSKNNFGIHTLNNLGDVIVIDALEKVFMPLTKLKLSLKKAIRK